MQTLKRYEQPAPDKYTDAFKRHAVAREQPQPPVTPPYAKAEHPNGVTLTRTDNVFVVTIRRDTETHTAVFDTNLELKTQFTMAN